MEIKYSTQSGTLESSDIRILVEPADPGSGRIIDLESIVLLQYGDDIRFEINKVLDTYKIDDIHVVAQDKGALTATIASRTETAIKRATGTQEGTLYVNVEQPTE